MMLISTIITLLVVYVSLKVFLLARRNRRAHQFFRIHAPDLPVAENPRLFSGHIFDISMNPKSCRIVDDLHKKLGPSFGHFYREQPWIATKDVDLIKKVHIEGGHLHTNRAFLGFPVEEFNNSIVEVGDADWRRARPAVAVSLTKHKVMSDEIAEDFSICVREFHSALEKKLDQVETKTGKRVLIIDDSHDTFERFTLAVILLAAYKQENVVDFNAKKDPWVKLIRDSLDNSNTPLLYLAIMFPFMRPIFTFLIKYHPFGRMPWKLLELLLENISLNKKAREFHEKLQKKLGLSDEKRQDFSAVKSQGDFKRRLADTLIDSHFEKKITYTDLRSNLLMLVLVGFETTANTATLLLFFIAKYQQIQEKLREEVRRCGVKSDYLEWCILETARYQSAVPFAGGRILKEDVTLNGVTYPKGAYILPSTYSIHHDPDLWPSPEAFIPERWSNRAAHHPASMLAFGTGARNCPGYQFTLQELKFAFEMLMNNYKIETCEDTVKEYSSSSPNMFYSLFDDKIKLKLTPLKKTTE